MEIEVTHKYVLSAQFLADIMCSALEGGIGYWCEADNIVQDTLGYVSFTATDAEGEDDFRHEVTREFVAEGIRRILADRNTIVGSHIAVNIRNAINDPENSGCYIDATVADIIVQVACFNEVIYG